MDDFENELLKVIAERSVVTKEELVKLLEDRVPDARQAVEDAAKSLYTQGLITYVTPIGKSCYAITQKGMRSV